MYITVRVKIILWRTIATTVRVDSDSVIDISRRLEEYHVYKPTQDTSENIRNPAESNKMHMI